MLTTKLALAPRRWIWRVAVSPSPIEGDVRKQRRRDRYCRRTYVSKAFVVLPKLLY